MIRDRTFPQHSSLQLDNDSDPEAVRLRCLIQTKYLGTTMHQWRLPHTFGCFSSQTNIVPSVHKRYPTSLVRACRNGNDSRAKGKMYSALRHNRSLQEKNSLRAERKENSSIHNTSVTHRAVPPSKMDELGGISATNWLSTQAERMRGLTPPTKKKRACLIPDPRNKELPMRNRIVEEDSHIVDYYKQKYERTVGAITPFSSTQIRLQSRQVQTPRATQHSRRRHMVKVKLQQPQLNELCIEPWESQNL